VRYSLQRAFEGLSLARVDAFAIAENLGSIRVLEKCSFAFLRYEARLQRNHYRIQHPRGADQRGAVSAARGPQS
jgi:RimJ/RimL family protein N-acetyltransferase